MLASTYMTLLFQRCKGRLISTHMIAYLVPTRKHRTNHAVEHVLQSLFPNNRKDPIVANQSRTQDRPQTETTPQPRRESYTRFFPETPEGKRPFSETIMKPLDEVAKHLTNFEKFPMFLENLEKVTTTGENKSDWQFRSQEDLSSSLKVPMRAILGINNDYTFQSEDGAGFTYNVRIELVPAQSGRGTIARMSVAYESTTGSIAAIFGKLFGTDANVLAKKNLQRFKAFCETGNVPTTEGQPSGREELHLNQPKH